MDKFKFARLKANIEATKRALPMLLAKQAENYFTETFKLQRLGPTQWANVQRRIPGTLEYKYPARPKSSSRTRPILIGTGNLRRKVSRSIHHASWTGGVTLIVDLPYAKIHNEGGAIHKDDHGRANFMKTTTKTYNGLKMNKKGKYKESFSTRTLYIRGEDVQVKAHDIKIPARPFMKQTAELSRMQRGLVKTHFDKIWK